ncbi:MAG: Fe-S-cluster containining protein [Parasphingorhabdus sp.]
MKECNQCGKCCIIYGDGGLSVLPAEVDWWETYRPEISTYVNKGKIWFSPTTGKQLERCPWLRKKPNENKYFCRIYHDRPDDCKQYPTSIAEMIRDGCEMLGPRDHLDQEQAQRTLDRLMSDSRPALGES